MLGAAAMSVAMSSRSFAAICAAVLLAVSGGVAATTARATSSVQARSSCGAAARNLKIYSLRTAGFRIGIPRSWNARWDHAGGDVLLAYTCELRYGRQSTLRASSWDVEHLDDWKFSDFEREAIREMELGAVVSRAPRIRAFSGSIGHAVRIHAVLHAPGDPVKYSRTTYMIRTRTTVYFVMYTTLVQLAPRYARLFDASARSLREF